MKEDVLHSPTLVDLLRQRAATQANDIAYEFLREDGSRQSLSYADLDARARATGVHLARAKLSGQRVVLLYPHGLEYIAAFFGCLYGGAIAVPVDPPRPKRPMRRLKAILQDAGARAVLTTPELLTNLSQRMESDSELGAVDWIASDRVAQAESDEWSRPELVADSLALLQYTSGSTGEPKGVMVSHGNLLQNLAAICEGFAIDGRHEVGVTWLPIYHDMGLVGGILEPMFVGRPAVVLSPVSFLKRPQLWLETISKFGGTISGGPNFAYQVCIERITDEQRSGLDLSSWTTAYCGAEPIRWDTLKQFAKKFAPCGFRFESFYPCFGLAESTLIVTGGSAAAAPTSLTIDKNALAASQIRLLEDGAADGLPSVSCGRGLRGQQVRIVDPQSRQEQPSSHVGEIWVRGGCVAKGYWGRQRQTVETFQARLADTGDGPYLRTGDLGFLHRGQLHVTGRLKDLIIIRGRNHYPQDIEQTVESSHEAFRSSGCVAFSVDTDSGSGLVIVQELDRRYRDADFSELLEVIRRAAVRDHAVDPEAIVLTRAMSLPKTSSGKVQRNECRKRFLSGELASLAQWRRSRRCETNLAAKAAPESASSIRPDRAEISAWLIDKLARRLNVSPHQIDPHAAYDSYGMDSVAGVELCGELESWLQRSVPPTLLYQHSSIAALADHLVDGQTTADFGDGVETYAEPIAIIGMACRFPGGVQDPEAYWRLLREGADAIVEVPPERWDSTRSGTPRWGGFIDAVDRFDADFFGITPREAQSMDPQQRMLLEVTWEALENAGLSPAELSGSSTGVFVGICHNDYARLQQSAGGGEIDAYAGTGCAPSIAAGRVSYLLGLQGISMPVDTACSSSLVAVHLACQSLLRNESRVALASGVNLMLSPETTLYFSEVRAMSADGRCKTFDESADGYVRGEGCGIVVLKRLTAARADGDPILAVIRGSAVNHDGASNGLTAPNPGAQHQVLRRALAVAGVEAADVDYVETHGTGTSLGDPIEVQALSTALTADRPQDRPLMLGSVKTNIGHLEAAAGVAGLIKTVLALQHDEIPPLLHLRKLNPQISTMDRGLEFPTRRTRWRSNGRRRIAGVSSFGFSGTNAHVLVEQADAPVEPSGDDRPAHLFALSAKSPEALRILVHRYRDRLQSSPDMSLADVCHTAGVGRTHFPHRWAVACESTDRLSEQLNSFSQVPVKRNSLDLPKVAMVFPPESTCDVQLVDHLDQAWPVFHKALEECDRLMIAGQRPSIVERLARSRLDGQSTGIGEDRILVLAAQYALAQLWKSWGVRPADVVGSGVGAVTAACIAGDLTVQQALRRIDTQTMATDLSVQPCACPAGCDFVIDVRVRPEGHGHDVPQGRQPIWLPGHQRRGPYSLWLLDALARLYVAGLNVDWRGLDRGRPRRRVRLPNYPFQRARFWTNGMPGQQQAGNSPKADAEPHTAEVTGNVPRSDLIDQIGRASDTMRPGLMLIYLRRQIAAVMEVEESLLDPADNLLESGFDSLMAMDVIEQVQSDFGFNLFPRELYDHPTINGLAAYLAAELTRCRGTEGSTGGMQTETDAAAVSDPGAVRSAERAGRSVNLLSRRPHPHPARSGRPIPDCVVLLSAPRSGSTLLRVMLAGHDELFSPPELHLLPFDGMAERHRMLADSYLEEGLVRALMELNQTDAGEAAAQVERWIRSDLPVDEVYRILKRLAGQRKLIDKSPTTTGTLETMQRAETWFEHARYIYLTRHPHAVIESLVRMRFDKLVGSAEEDPHRWAEQVWRQAQVNACQFLESVERDRKCQVQFERLVAEPEKTMRQIADFLGVAFQPSMVQPYSGNRMTDGVTSSARPIDDPNFRRHNRIDPGIAHAWRDRPRTWTLSVESAEVADQLGYRLAGARAVTSITPESSTAAVSTVTAGPTRRHGAAAHVAMRERFLDVGRRRLCCCSWGSDRNPTVLCLHGILDQGPTWKLVAERLVGEGFHVVAPDLRGHGRSGHAGPEGSYRILDFLSDADAVLRAIRDDRVLLAGHSLGAVVATQLALARSDRVERLVAIEPPQTPERHPSMPEQLAGYLDHVASDAAHDLMSSLDAAVHRLRRAIPSLPDDLAQLLARRATRETPDGWTWRWDARLRSRKSLSLVAEHLGTTRFSDLVGQLSMPATVLIGAQSTHRRDRAGEAFRSLTPSVDAGEMCSQVERVIIDGGHHLTVESADQVATVIAGAYGT